MALKLKHVIDSLTDVPGPVREYYAPTIDGKFALGVDNSEFRDRNVALLKEVEELRPLKAKYEGVDLEEYKALKAKAAAGDPDALVALKLELATEKGKAAAATRERDALAHRQAVSAAFVAAGGRPEAVDYIVGKAPFTVVDGELKPKDGESSPTINEWLLDQAAGANAFAFQKNTGGGSTGGKPSALALGARSNVRILRNPTPAELGANANDIAAGKVKVEITT